MMNYQYISMIKFNHILLLFALYLLIGGLECNLVLDLLLWMWMLILLGGKQMMMISILGRLFLRLRMECCRGIGLCWGGWSECLSYRLFIGCMKDSCKFVLKLAHHYTPTWSKTPTESAHHYSSHNQATQAQILTNTKSQQVD